LTNPLALWTIGGLVAIYGMFIRNQLAVIQDLSHEKEEAARVVKASLKRTLAQQTKKIRLLEQAAGA
jgi:hypothetical protein